MYLRKNSVVYKSGVTRLEALKRNREPQKAAKMLSKSADRIYVALLIKSKMTVKIEAMNKQMGTIIQPLITVF